MTFELISILRLKYRRIAKPTRWVWRYETPNYILCVQLYNVSF